MWRVYIFGWCVIVLVLCVVDRFVVASVGFDERFIVRLMVSCGLGVGSSDFILLVTPEEGEDRCLRVVEHVREFTRSYRLNLSLEVLRVDVGSFWGAAGSVRNAVEEYFSKLNPREFIVLLSGGMRALVLEVLLGCIASRLKGKVIVYREDLKGHIEFPLEIFSVERPSIEELKVLKVLKESETANLRVIAAKLNTSKASAFRIVKRLEEKSLVKVEHRGRASRIILTEKAKLWI